jgi:hypothetical protein
VWNSLAVEVAIVVTRRFRICFHQRHHPDTFPDFSFRTLGTMSVFLARSKARSLNRGGIYSPSFSMLIPGKNIRALNSEKHQATQFDTKSVHGT